MKKKIIVALLVAIALIITVAFLRSTNAAASAPNKKAFAGAWERISLKDEQGQPNPNAAVSMLVFSAEGYYAQTSIPAGRSKIDKPLNEMTKEELLNRVRSVTAHSGTFSIAGNTLTRKTMNNFDPSREGTDINQDFKFEGDLLILTGKTNKSEARFRRLK